MFWRVAKRSSGNNRRADVRKKDGPEEAPADTEGKGGDRGSWSSCGPSCVCKGISVEERTPSIWTCGKKWEMKNMDEDGRQLWTEQCFYRETAG